jgi:hypothetical protein
VRSYGRDELFNISFNQRAMRRHLPQQRRVEEEEEEEEECSLFRDRQGWQQEAQQLSAETHWRQEAATALQRTQWQTLFCEEAGTSGRQQVQEEVEDACLLHLGLRVEAVAAAVAAAEGAGITWHTGE